MTHTFDLGSESDFPWQIWPLLQFVRGNIHGIETGFGLEARHVLVIGLYAQDMDESWKYHALTVEWLELAKALTTNDAGIDLDAMILSAVTKVETQF